MTGQLRDTDWQDHITLMELLQTLGMSEQAIPLYLLWRIQVQIGAKPPPLD